MKTVEFRVTDVGQALLDYEAAKPTIVAHTDVADGVIEALKALGMEGRYKVRASSICPPNKVYLNKNEGFDF